MFDDVPEELKLTFCIGLSVIGSFSYIFGIMCLAYPTFLTEQKGTEWSRWHNLAFFGLYALGQSGALAFPLIASWFGPVSIQLPVYQASMLLWNKLLMRLLGMEKTFMKDQRAGTEIIVVATVMLVDAGPMATDVVIHPDFGAPPTAFWLIFLGCLWIASGVGMVQDALGYPLSVNVQMAIYVLAQGIGTSATTTLGKLLSLESGFILALVGLLYVAAGATNTVSSIIAAKKLNQADFIPFASVCSLALNQTTGLLVWEDWKFISLWVTYIGIHVLIGLGIYDLSNVGSKIFEYAATAGFGKYTSLKNYSKMLSIVEYWKRYKREDKQAAAKRKNRAKRASTIAYQAQAQRRDAQSAKPRSTSEGGVTGGAALL